MTATVLTSPALTDMFPSTYSPFGEGDDIKDLDPTPRASHEPWRFTPSMLDPNSFAFHTFANQPPGYYTPTPGGTNTLYHHQAGDLHTPSGFTMGLGTPLSMPTSEGAVHAVQHTTAGMAPFTAMAPHSFENPNPFSLPSHGQHHPQEASFAPHQFHHHDTFHPMDSHADAQHMAAISSDVEMHEGSPVLAFPPQSFGTAMHAPMFQAGEKYVSRLISGDNSWLTSRSFRFHSTLNAPTAMIKHADEIPVTYLNKGQAYSISVVDTAPQLNQPMPLRYRTFVRISFEDELQRQRPGACWQLWKEGRGTNEAHHRGGKLQAVEFVDPAQAGGGEIVGRPRFEVESTSFDGFCVTWSPPTNAPAECAIAVRFNFLSTDFSHSKGVKGIPVRLCAKTEQLVPQSPTAQQPTASEICYCKVKLFRDHGAERKLSNDVQHVKKSIDKLKQQIAQLESGMKDFGKRKRSGSGSKTATGPSRPGKVPKHKRTWSMSSASDTGNRPAPEEDLHIKLQTLTDMFTSTRPASVLFLRGEELDDPDLHPVSLAGEPSDLARINTADSTSFELTRQLSVAGTSSIVSPTPSNQSMPSNGEDGRRSSGLSRPTPFKPLSRVSSNEWRNTQQTATGDIVGGAVAPPSATVDSPMRVPKRASTGQGHLPGWIEAVGVDPSYQPPPERVIKPGEFHGTRCHTLSLTRTVACFYVQLTRAGMQPDDSYYRAIYLMRRTLKDFINAVASKADLEPTKVVRTLRINQKGLQIVVDDEMMQELPEGVDMVVEIQDLHPEEPMKREWDAGPTDVQVDGDIGFIDSTTTDGYELRLHF